MGKLAEIKTQQTAASVEDFISNIKDEQKRKDSSTILQVMEKATNQKPKMWGASIIGFGNVRYKSPATGREVDWFTIGFSPRKANLTLYLNGNLQRHADALKKLGKHKTGVGCLYVNKLADVDMKTLEQIIKTTVQGK
jgi:glutamine phosphoribosylpyrophosphate amidotransferase